ncbi:MAG: Gfo/Idh/MocA family oxidoreductase [Verrucomicrobiae bacterium]|nr:Gfo/Idh/MocA family oxidoreductase [Verrucomicrobiae bacterium]
MKKLNVGIIGYGWVATAHIPAINASSLGQVTAVCSRRPLDGGALSRQYGCDITVYNDLEVMLANPEIQVVSICSMPSLHVRQAVRAARAGKHLILEKPLALSLKDLHTLQQAVRQARVKTCAGFELRYSSQFQTTRTVLEAGVLGKLHYAEVDYYHGIGPWYGQFRWNVKRNEGGSALLSAGCHALDALLFCMGGEVESVASYSAKSANPTFRAYEYPTTSTTILKFKDGRIGKTAVSIDCFQPYYLHTHLVGSEGSLLDNKFHSNKLGTNKQQWSELALKLADSGDVSDHPYAAQFEAFFKAIADGKEMPFTNLESAAKTHEIIFAADKSAATGKPVRL